MDAWQDSVRETTQAQTVSPFTFSLVIQEKRDNSACTSLYTKLYCLLWHKNPRPLDLQTSTFFINIYFTFLKWKDKRRKENIFLFRLLYLLVFMFQKLNQTEGVVLKDYAMLLLFG